MSNEAKLKRIVALAKKIDALMREQTDRWEAIDAHDMARILFRTYAERSKSASPSSS